MHIWHIDETKFSLEHNPTKICARKGERNIPGRVGMSRESLTWSIYIKAAGVAMPPMLILRGKTPDVFCRGELKMRPMAPYQLMDLPREWVHGRCAWGRMVPLRGAGPS